MTLEKVFVLQNKTFFIWDKYCHLPLCLRLIGKNLFRIFGVKLTRHSDVQGLLCQAADVHVEVAVLLLELAKQESVKPVGKRVAVVVRETHPTEVVVKDLVPTKVVKRTS